MNLYAKIKLERNEINKGADFMKKLLSMLLTLILCLGVFVSCNDETQTESSSEKEKITVKDIDTGLEGVLSDEDAQLLFDINLLNEDTWGMLVDFQCDYVFYVNDSEILYSATDGIFEHNGKSLLLDDENAGRVYAMLEKYFSQIYFFPELIVKNVSLSTEVRVSYFDYCDIEDILQNAQWQPTQSLINKGAPTLYHFHFKNLTFRYSSEGLFFDEEWQSYSILNSEERARINAILEKYPSLNKQQ